jgi:hypothetical protein
MTARRSATALLYKCNTLWRELGRVRAGI